MARAARGLKVYIGGDETQWIYGRMHDIVQSLQSYQRWLSKEADPSVTERHLWLQEIEQIRCSRSLLH